MGRQQQQVAQQQAAQHQLSQHGTQRPKTEGLINFDVQQQPLELDLRQVVQQAQAQAAQQAAQQAASQHQQQHHVSAASQQQQYVSQQPNQQQQVQQVAQQLQQQTPHQEPQKMQPTPRSGPVPLLQQRMESTPQAPLQAPPPAAANPPDLPLPPKILNIKKEHPSEDMHMPPLDRQHPEKNAWHSNTNGPSIPPIPPVVPPAVPVQPTGPPSDAEFEMLQTRIQSMDPILVWNLVRIKILPNFSPWDFLCDRTRLCGPKYGQTDQNSAGGHKLPTSVAKLKFLLQEMNDLAEELSHLVDNCCDIIDDTENEDDSEVPDGMDDIDEEEVSDNEKKPIVDGTTKDSEDKIEEECEKPESETVEEDKKNEKVEEDKSSEPTE